MSANVPSVSRFQKFDTTQSSRTQRTPQKGLTINPKTQWKTKRILLACCSENRIWKNVAAHLLNLLKFRYVQILNSRCLVAKCVQRFSRFSKHTSSHLAQCLWHFWANFWAPQIDVVFLTYLQIRKFYISTDGTHTHTHARTLTDTYVHRYHLCTCMRTSKYISISSISIQMYRDIWAFFVPTFFNRCIYVHLCILTRVF